MAKLTKQCPVCNKPADESYRQVINELNLAMIGLKCGHTYTEKLTQLKDWEMLTSEVGVPKIKLFKYQGEGYEFARNANFRCLIGDEPGLGKTFQAFACLKLHEAELTPCLYVAKAALKIQVMKELIRFCGFDFLPQIIANSSDKPIEGQHVVIVTYDMLWRITKKQTAAYDSKAAEIRKKLNLPEWEPIPEEYESELPSVENPFKGYGFKSIILDECQQIKNPNSRRAQQVRELAKDIPHVIALSGSPIENNAGEYFTILNILKPERFRTYKAYVENYCDWYWNGHGYKIGGLRDVQWFKEQTADFIIRRKQKDVQPDLPDLNRRFVHCDFANEKTKRDYDRLAEEFSEFFYENEGDKDLMQGILARMAKMRHQVGLNKVPFVTEFVTDWINDTDPTRKIVIFTHHQDVMQMISLNLQRAFKEMRENGSEIADPLVYSADLSGEKRNDVIDNFKNLDNARVMIASTLAASEGLNLQFCSDCIFMERQWNPKKEEQGERRFIRPGGKVVDVVNANYVIVSGSIDEYLTELIEIKRANTDQTLDGTEMDWNESNLMKELAQTLAQKGGKKWKLS